MEYNNHQVLDCVSFEPETDCRSAFPNEKSFHSFRRQRDQFYDLFNKWKSDQSHSSFSSLTSVDPRNRFEATVTRLLATSYDSSNMYHLAKLFVSQLIQTCIMGGTKELLSNGHPDQFISKIHDSKLRKLRKRLDHVESGESSSFSDEEIFFHEFIINVKNQAFLSYLKLLLIQKIKETNDCSPLYRELDDDLIRINGEKKQIKAHFTKLSLTLQVLAKFLGLIVYLPFQTSFTSKSEQFTETQINLRKDESCCLDIIGFLKEAIDKKKLSLTLPWVIHFLRQMDPITPKLPNYQVIINFIKKLHQDLSFKKIRCESNIKAYLLYSLDPFIDNYRNSFSSKICNGHLNGTNESIVVITFDDRIDLIDEDYTSESGINSSSLSATLPSQQSTSMLTTKSPKETKLTTPRKIRPLTLISKESKSINSASERQNKFQKNLEESNRDVIRELETNFLSLHPMSLKKVIELVSERIFSKCIKELKHHVIDEAKDSVKPLKLDEDSETFNYNRRVIVDTIRTKCSNFAHDYCKTESSQILPMLLSQRDYTPSAMKFAIDLTSLKSSERCCQWIIGNINPNWLSSQLESEAKLTPKAESEVIDNLPDISINFNSLRNTVCDLFMRKITNISQSTLVSLINDLTQLRLYKSLGEKTLKIIDMSIADLMIALVANVPANCDDTVIQSLITFWKTSDDKLFKFVCPRNLFILINSSNYSQCWEKFTYLLTILLNQDVYLIPIFEQDCLWTLDNIDKDSIRSFSISLKKIISYQRKFREDLNILKDLSKWLDSYDDINFPKLS